MKIKQDLISSNRYGIKSPHVMTPKGVCIHNTANDASAKNEIAYMKRNNNQVSFHIAVDDIEAIQAIPFERNAWHAGDGGSGDGNRNYIAIEICYSKSGGNRFAKAEQNAVKVVAQICKQFGFTISNIKKHQDFSNKYCPHRTLDLGWNRFLKMIEVELNGNTLKNNDNKQISHKIQNGDTLFSIAKKYNTTVGEIRRLNNINDVNIIYVGDVLKLPSKAPQTQSKPKVSKPKGVIATIQDTLNKRYNLNIKVDDIPGPETKKALVMAYQIELNKQFGAGLVVDGIFGAKTRNASRNIRKGARGNLTWILQAILYCLGYSLTVDSVFGNETERAVRNFQTKSGIAVDGVPGKVTWSKLFT